MTAFRAVVYNRADGECRLLALNDVTSLCADSDFTHSSSRDSVLSIRDANGEPITLFISSMGLVLVTVFVLILQYFAVPLRLAA